MRRCCGGGIPSFSSTRSFKQIGMFKELKFFSDLPWSARLCRWVRCQSQFLFQSESSPWSASWLKHGGTNSKLWNGGNLENYSDLSGQSDKWKTTQTSLTNGTLLRRTVSRKIYQVILSHDERLVSNALKFSVIDMANTMMFEIWTTHNRHDIKRYKIKENLGLVPVRESFQHIWALFQLRV